MQRGPVVASDDLGRFFDERVRAVGPAVDASVSDLAGAYLSGLLALRARMEHEDALTLAELRLRASSLHGRAALRWWLRLGDDALLRLAWFSGALTRRGVSTVYARDLGRDAYRRVHAAAGGPYTVFGELAAKFDACVDILAGVRALCSPADLEELYDALLEGASEASHARALSRLRAHGVFVIAPPSDLDA